MMYSLSDKSVKTRYMASTMAFPHRDIQRVTNIDYHQDVAIVAVVPGVSGEEIVAIAQYFLDPKTQAAEVAFLVQDEWQRKGIGTLLLDYITQIAKQRGVQRFCAKVLPTNDAMLAIFHNSGYNINTTFDGYAYDITYDLKKSE